MTYTGTAWNVSRIQVCLESWTPVGEVWLERAGAGAGTAVRGTLVAAAFRGLSPHTTPRHPDRQLQGVCGCVKTTRRGKADAVWSELVTDGLPAAGRHPHEVRDVAGSALAEGRPRGSWGEQWGSGRVRGCLTWVDVTGRRCPLGVEHSLCVSGLGPARRRPPRGWALSNQLKTWVAEKAERESVVSLRPTALEPGRWSHLPFQSDSSWDSYHDLSWVASRCWDSMASVILGEIFLMINLISFYLFMYVYIYM